MRRESKVASKELCASTSAGMPRRPTVWLSMAWTGALRIAELARLSGRSDRGRAPSGREVTDRPIGWANWGAPAAEQKVLIISTTGCGSGLTKWKASRSCPGTWARWSIALAT